MTATLRRRLPRDLDDAKFEIDAAVDAYRSRDYELAADLMGRASRSTRKAQLVALRRAGITRGRR